MRPQGKIIAIDTVSQSRLNAIKNQEIYRKLKKIGSGLLGVTPRRSRPEINNFGFLMSPFQSTLRFIKKQSKKHLRVTFKCVFLKVFPTKFQK